MLSCRSAIIWRLGGNSNLGGGRKEQPCGSKSTPKAVVINKKKPVWYQGISSSVYIIISSCAIPCQQLWQCHRDEWLPGHWSGWSPHRTSRYSVMQTHFMSFDQFEIAAGCPARLVLVKWHIICHQRWDYKMHELTTRHYSVGEVWASLTKSKTIFCAGSNANLRRKCTNNFKIEAGILYYRNVPPEVRNHGRYVQEARIKRRESLSHALLTLQVCKV